MENVTVKCMDTDDHLEVWSYSECGNDSPHETKAHRGIIKDKAGNVVVSSFGYTDEYTEDDCEKIQKKVGDNLDDWIFQYSVEGTLLRMFFYQDQWYLSTHKKLNAFKSRWSCKQTFGELFVEGLGDIYESEILESGNLEHKSPLEWLQEQLPRENVYFFLVRSNMQNRIVCHAHHLKKKESIVFLGHYVLGSHENCKFVYNNKEKSEDETIAVLQKMECPPTLPHTFSTVEEIVETVKTIDPFFFQGVIAFHKTGLESFKVLNNEYVHYYSVRGNNPNLRFRYLEIRKHPELVKLLYVLYPKYTLLFDEYEGALYEIAKVIYQFYVNRYIKNQYITLPREEYVLLKKCHQWYLEDRKNNRIFTQKVLELLGNEPPLSLYKMIRRFHLDRGDGRGGNYARPYAPSHMKIEVPVFNQKQNREFMASLPPLSPPYGTATGMTGMTGMTWATVMAEEEAKEEAVAEATVVPDTI
jgi:hypothetical protein